MEAPHQSLESEFDRLNAQFEKLQLEFALQQRRHAAEIGQLLATERKARQQLEEAYRNSSSWRMTAPLRALSSQLRGLKGNGEPQPHDTPDADRGPDPAATFVAGDAKQATRAVLKTQLDAFLTSVGKLDFKKCTTPDVSIVLVLYNSAELTLACLNSISVTLQGTPLQVELVILDNGSTDATDRLLDRIQGATIIRSAENLHFLRGANRAAQAARGMYLLFLNNDALLMPGSLEAAVSVFVNELDVGAVGGRVLLPTGKLQEAGSIVWRDGACAGYGRNAMPDAAEYMFRRDVDYCSGAFLLTLRAQFDRMGGFDERYAPAYYEETDYCLRLWELGLRVVFEPDVVILHFEFGSAGADQAIELQQRNQQIFRDRHAARLQSQWVHSPTALVHTRDAQSKSKRILHIEDRVPLEYLGSGYPRSADLVRALSKGGAMVTFFPLTDHAESWKIIRDALPMNVEVMRGHDYGDLPAFLAARRGYYDAVLVSRPHNMQNFLAATNNADPAFMGQAALIYDAEAMFALRTLAQSSLSGQPYSDEAAQQLVSQEVELTRLAHAVISVSHAERQEFERHGARNVHVVGHSLEASPTPGVFEQRADFLFVGSVHDDDSPNADSLRWFANDIWPAVRAALGPEVRLYVVGRILATTVQALADKSLRIVGSVDDLDPWYHRSRVVIAPTRYAAGLPMKVHGAAARGVPVVATTLIARQLGWTSETHLLAADTADDFAAACVRLYSDPALWKALRDAALERVAQDCSPAQFEQTVQSLLSSFPLVHDRATVVPR